MSITRIAGLAAAGAIALALLHLFSSHAASGLSGGRGDPLIVSGPARVIDADTLEIEGLRIRLEGVDAPEAGQVCPTRSGRWQAGQDARRQMTWWTAGQQVRCRIVGRDTYGRALGHCFTGDRDLNADLVEAGLAWAFVKYSQNYLAQQTRAKAARRGIWAASCQVAWEYRNNRWADVSGRAPEGCPIKGNITRRGRIYHMPWSPWYGRTRIQPDKGERWFCNEHQARAAGWRPAG